jgi:hypothetical protein
MRLISCLVLLVGSVMMASAQPTDQLWLDFQAGYPFANKYLFEVTTSYQTILSGSSKWRSININPTFEDNLVPWVTLVASAPVTFTVQKEGANSFEVSPSLGGRFYFSQGRRIEPRLTVKAEERFFHKIESDQWETSSRLRVKAEAWIAINGPNLFTDKLWYAFLDYEEFIVVDQQVSERFAYIRRGHLGAGYRLSYAHRFEIAYTKQSSRDQIDGDFINSDNIVQLRYKLYLNASKVN